MRIPRRLDYYEAEDGGDWYPFVYCRTRGCDWEYQANWNELGPNNDTDWDVIHPDHGTVTPIHNNQA